MANLLIRGYCILELGGASRPCQMGLAQARAFCESFPETMELGAYQDLVGKLDLKNTTFETEETFRRLIYSGLKAGAQKEHLDTSFSLEDVSWWVDEAPLTAVVPFIRAISDMNVEVPALGNESGQATKTKKK